jgi:hypothetical protein
MAARIRNSKIFLHFFKVSKIALFSFSEYQPFFVKRQQLKYKCSKTVWGTWDRGNIMASPGFYPTTSRYLSLV